MSSRDKILAAVAAAQPINSVLPDLGMFKKPVAGVTGQFVQVLTSIGGRVINVNSWEEIAAIATAEYAEKRIITPISELPGFKNIPESTSPHDLFDVEFAIIKAHFGVAENGAVWVTEDNMGMRALPFITQHLAVVLPGDAIVPTMAEAYDKIAELPPYDFASFIAGPSKTADIEQSLVIGAHGPRSMTVFILT